ncbi:hypothetical protein MHK_008404 [Candidatus Magnetomorum sp. HK-1]|nr:hypothetical protein MHK_008404 [Candidatus Magnetomorum sp. HK-1]
MKNKIFISIFFVILLIFFVKSIIDKKEIIQKNESSQISNKSFELEGNNTCTKNSDLKKKPEPGSSIKDEPEDEPKYGSEVEIESSPDSHSNLMNRPGNWAINNKIQKFGQQEISSYLKEQLREEFNTVKQDEIIRQLNEIENGALTKINEYIDRIKDCYKNEDTMCTSNTDPKADYFNKAWDLVYMMDVLSKLNNVTDDEKRAFTQKLSDTDNDWVREKNLEILAAMPNNPVNLDISMKTIEQSSDPSLYKIFADESKKKYNDDSSLDKISDFFVDTIKNGGFFLGKEASTMVLDFITPSNIDKYKNLLKELNKGSYRYIALKQTLEEYEKAHPVKN